MNVIKNAIGKEFTLEEVENIIRKTPSVQNTFEKSKATDILNYEVTWFDVEKEIDSKVSERIAFSSKDEQQISKESYTTISKIKDSEDRVNMKYAFCEYLEMGKNVWKDSVAEIEELIDEVIVCFSFETRQSLYETNEVISRINDSADRETMKIVFCDYIQGYKDMLEFFA